MYAMRERVGDGDGGKELVQLQHKTVLSVTADIEAYRFNTAVSSLMIFAECVTGCGDGATRGI